MKDTLSLDALKLFLAVAEAGGLAGAVAETGQSAPTLSRKMTGLERQTGRRLFLRGNQGFQLTADGRALAAEASDLVGISRRLSRWSTQSAPSRVRITAGVWTSAWLARHARGFWSSGDGWVPEFVSSNAVLDISRREADIGIRNRRPEQAWLAGRRLRQIDYAEFGKDQEVAGFVSLAEGASETPSARWVASERAGEIVTTVSDMRLGLELACAGVGRIVLPTFAAEDTSGLVQVSDPIEALSHDEWLVTHHEARHDPPIRRALDALTRFMTTRTE